MTDADTVLCPDCGWTGDRADLVRDGPAYSCPICAETVEIVD